MFSGTVNLINDCIVLITLRQRITEITIRQENVFNYGVLYPSQSWHCA